MAEAFIVVHDPGWLERGAGLAAQVLEVLGPLAVRVEHIGSTSVPGMAAKPVFDLQVSVVDLAAAAVFDAPWRHGGSCGCRMSVIMCRRGRVMIRGGG